MGKERPRRRGRTLVASLVLAVALLAACGDDGTSEPGAPPGEEASAIVDAGTLTRDLLQDADPSAGWERAGPDPFPDELADCHDLTRVDGGPSGEGAVVEVSPSFGAPVPEGPTRNAGSVIGAVLVYANAEEAADALAAIDAELFTTCLDSSAPDGERDEIEVEVGPDLDVGAESTTLTVTLDDFVFFEGNDNAHHGDLYAVRADRTVVTVLFTYTGQTVDTARQVEPEGQIVESLVAAVEAAQ